MVVNAPNPLFQSTSNEKPKLLTISFKDDPQGSLGAQLINCDKVSVGFSGWLASGAAVVVVVVIVIPHLF